MKVARLGLLMLVVLLAQVSVLGWVAIDGWRWDAFVLVGVCAGLAAGPQGGATVGFTAGLVADLFVRNTPFGLSALVYALVGYSAGVAHTAVLRVTWRFVPLAGFVFSAFGVLLFGVVGSTIGDAHLVRLQLLQTAGVVGILNAALAPLLLTVTKATLRVDDRTTV